MSFTSAEARRRAVAQILEEAEGPVSAAALARRFSVSRQIIVGDVALLRAGGADILATPRGYLLGGRVAEHGARPLADLTDGIHLHTVRCPDEKTFQQVEELLRNENFLLEM